MADVESVGMFLGHLLLLLLIGEPEEVKKRTWSSRRGEHLNGDPTNRATCLSHFEVKKNVTCHTLE